jgi:hypothetical protein
LASANLWKGVEMKRHRELGKVFFLSINKGQADISNLYPFKNRLKSTVSCLRTRSCRSLFRKNTEWTDSRIVIVRAVLSFFSRSKLTVFEQTDDYAPLPESLAQHLHRMLRALPSADHFVSSLLDTRMGNITRSMIA